MNYRKIEYLERLIERRNEIFLGGQYNFLIHSVLNTIDLIELIDYFFSLHSDTDVKRSIESNIHKRAKNYFECNSLFDQLLERLDDSDYRKRQRIRKILKTMIPSMDTTFKQLFFDIFFKSKYVYDVEAAISICDSLWDDSLNDKMILGYLKTANEAYLRAFLKNGDVAKSLQYIQRIWELSPSNYLKIDLIVKLSRNHIDAFSFLREIDPEKFLMVMSYSGKVVDDSTILECYNSIEDDQKPFGLMSIGRLNKWDLIEDELKKYVN